MLTVKTPIEFLHRNTFQTSVTLGFLIVAAVISQSGVATAAPQKQSDATSTAESDKSKLPRKVIVKKAGAELRTPEKIVWKAYLGETYTVDLEKDEWLWVQEKGGWVWDQHVLPFDTAISATTKEIETAATAENHHLRGVAYLAHDEPDKAIEDFNASLKLTPGVAGVINNRGMAYYQKKDYAKAKADFSAAIKASKTHFVAHNNRALCLIAEEDYTAALADLNVALGMNAEYPEALNSRGVVYSRQGDYKKAIADFSSAIKIYDRYIEALGNRSFAYRKSGETAKAIADLEAAIQKAPLAYQPINDLAWIYATAKSKKVRNGKKAVELATKACEMTQYKDWNTLDTLAAAYAADKDFKSASQWVATAIENAPEDQHEGLKTHQKLFKSKKLVTSD